MIILREREMKGSHVRQRKETVLKRGAPHFVDVKHHIAALSARPTLPVHALFRRFAMRSALSLAASSATPACEQMKKDCSFIEEKHSMKTSKDVFVQ